MFKKISLTLLISILAATSAAGLVFAKDQSSEKHSADFHPNRLGLIGKIIEIGANDFEVELFNGETHRVSVTPETVFRSREGELGAGASFTDLKVGMWVAVYQRPNESGTTGASLVVLQPEYFDPSHLRAKRILGEVDKINPGQNTFELVSRNGETLTLWVSEQTRFAGGLDDFGDLKKDMLVAVAAVEQQDGTLLAKLVGTRAEERARLQKTSGKISQIGNSSITIAPRQGEQQAFTITGETRFGSRQANIQGLEDLEIGVAVVVVHHPDHDQAIAVLVADPALLKLERVRGTVQSAGGSHLTIEVEGEKIQFTVDENTRLHSRGAAELNDLKNGMHVLVLYVEQDGILLAKGILAGIPGNN